MKRRRMSRLSRAGVDAERESLHLAAGVVQLEAADSLPRSTLKRNGRKLSVPATGSAGTSRKSSAKRRKNQGFSIKPFTKKMAAVKTIPSQEVSEILVLRQSSPVWKENLRRNLLSEGISPAKAAALVKLAAS